MAFFSEKMAFSVKKWHFWGKNGIFRQKMAFSVKKWHFQWKSPFLGENISLRRGFFFCRCLTKAGVFSGKRPKKAGWNRFFLTKKNEQIEGGKLAAEGGRKFFGPLFKPKQEKNESFSGFVPQKQNQMKINLKKSRLKSKKIQKKSTSKPSSGFWPFWLSIYKKNLHA